MVRIMVDEFIRLHLDEKLTAEQAAMAKWYSTEKQVHLIDRCLQLHGGYGYMREYPVARAYLDARVQTIYGGTTEIMKEIIGRSHGRLIAVDESGFPSTARSLRYRVYVTFG